MRPYVALLLVGHLLFVISGSSLGFSASALSYGRRASGEDLCARRNLGVLQVCQGLCRQIAHIAGEVTAEQNAGEWLSSQFTKESLRTVIEEVVLSRPSTVDQAFCAPLSLVPRESMNDVWVTLDQLDFTSRAKNGCR